MLNILKSMPAILVLIFCLMSLPSKSTEIQTYLTSKGPAVVITNQVANLAKTNNITINTIHSVNCGSAIQKFKNEKSPAAILISHNQYRLSRSSNQDCVIDDFESTKVIFITHATQEVCVKGQNNIPTNRIATLGLVRFSPYNAITIEMNKNVMDTKFKHVLFNSSDEVLQALVNKDIDVGFMSLSVSAEAIKSGTIKCLYSTGSNKFQQLPLRQFTGRDTFVNQESVSFMLVVKNLSFADELKLSESIKILPDKLSAQYIDTTSVLPSKEEVVTFIQRAKSAEYLD